VSASVVVVYLSVGCLEKGFSPKYLRVFCAVLLKSAYFLTFRVFCAVLLNSTYFLTFSVFGSCLNTLASNAVTDSCVVGFCLVLCVL